MPTGESYYVDGGQRVHGVVQCAVEARENVARLRYPYLSMSVVCPIKGLSQPHVCEDQENSQEETQPCTPANARTLGHAEHASHVTTKSHASVVECIVEL